MNDALLLSLASGGGHPLIDIDWTAAIQFGVFAMTAIVASQMFFKPYLKMREERSAGIEGAREEATSMTSQADAQLADYEEKLISARNRAQDERRKVRAEAAAHQRETTEAARKEAESALADAQDKVKSETEKARAELMPKADLLSKQIASKLLGRELA